MSQPKLLDTRLQKLSKRNLLALYASLKVQTKNALAAYERTLGDSDPFEAAESVDNKERRDWLELSRYLCKVQDEVQERAKVATTEEEKESWYFGCGA